MNRMEEYQHLLKELESVPEALEATVERAWHKSTAFKNKKKTFGISMGSFAACFAVFVLMINLFPPFAKACGNIPLLRKLTEAVRFSPSLSAAVENQYVQPIGITQTHNQVTASVEHVIVDRKQVSIFFALDTDLTEYLGFKYDINIPGKEMGYSSSTGSFGKKNGELRQISVDFMDTDVPDTLQLILKVYDDTAAWCDTEIAPETSIYDDPKEPEHQILAEFEFTLEFDPYFTAQGEVISINQTFIIDGQTMTLTEVEVYPTHLRVILDDEARNTAWLKSLDLYLENEYGERFESNINGISASGDPDGEGYSTFWLDSPFFSQGEELTLYITGSRWLKKEKKLVCVDLEQQTATGLAEDILFVGAEKHQNEWWISFAAPQEADGGMYQLFSGHFWDQDGNEYDIMQWGSSIGYKDRKTGEYMAEETMFTDMFPLKGFDGDVVYLEPVFTKTVSMNEEPVCIPIK